MEEIMTYALLRSCKVRKRIKNDEGKGEKKGNDNRTTDFSVALDDCKIALIVKATVTL